MKPHVGDLRCARGKVPTPLGTVLVDWKRTKSFSLSLRLPQGMSARVELPAEGSRSQVFVNGKRALASRRDSWWVLEQSISGVARIELK